MSKKATGPLIFPEGRKKIKEGRKEIEKGRKEGN
jgi:hypothetical protein